MKKFALLARQSTLHLNNMRSAKPLRHKVQKNKYFLNCRRSESNGRPPDYESISHRYQTVSINFTLMYLMLVIKRFHEYHLFTQYHLISNKNTIKCTQKCTPAESSRIKNKFFLHCHFYHFHHLLFQEEKV